MRHVTSAVCKELHQADWPENVVGMVTKIRHYRDMLDDFRQGQILAKLGRGWISHCGPQA